MQSPQTFVLSVFLVSYTSRVPLIPRRIVGGRGAYRGASLSLEGALCRNKTRTLMTWKPLRGMWKRMPFGMVLWRMADCCQGQNR